MSDRRAAMHARLAGSGLYPELGRSTRLERMTCPTPRPGEFEPQTRWAVIRTYDDKLLGTVERYPARRPVDGHDILKPGVGCPPWLAEVDGDDDDRVDWFSTRTLAVDWLVSEVGE